RGGRYASGRGNGDRSGTTTDAPRRVWVFPCDMPPIPFEHRPVWATRSRTRRWAPPSRKEPIDHTSALCDRSSWSEYSRCSKSSATAPDRAALGTNAAEQLLPVGQNDEAADRRDDTGHIATGQAFPFGQKFPPIRVITGEGPDLVPMQAGQESDRGEGEHFQEAVDVLLQRVYLAILGGHLYIPQGRRRVDSRGDVHGAQHQRVDACEQTQHDRDSGFGHHQRVDGRLA